MIRCRPAGDAALLLELPAGTTATPAPGAAPGHFAPSATAQSPAAASAAATSARGSSADAASPAAPPAACSSAAEEEEAGQGSGWRGAAALAAAITAACLPAVTDVVPGAASVLVIIEPGSWRLGRLAEVLRAIEVPAAEDAGRRTVDIPVLYDGPDLADVARLTGLCAAEVAARHAAAAYTVCWLGFCPGFGYLSGLDPLLAQVPRLATPRSAVPAGSVALAGGMSAVYPCASPGGWRLIGRTAIRLWDPARQPPALLAPGTLVRFHSIDALPAAAADSQRQGQTTAFSGPADHPPPDETPLSGIAGLVDVIRPGPLATIQDLGRPGYASMGVPPSGAADLPSLLAANSLAGNNSDAACIELTLGRAVFRFSAASRIALTGASAPASLAAAPGAAPREVPFGAAVDVPAGSVLTIGAPTAGLRSYLAVRGGFDVQAVLGSRSSDLLSGLGPAPLTAGSVLPVGARQERPAAAAGPFPGGTWPPWLGVPPAPGSQRPGARSGPGTAERQVADGDPVLRVVPGPRADWLAADALDTLCAARYVVRAESNRSGVRLSGPPLDWATEAELPSEGLVTGAIQVPRDGQPILHLADHPVTGGYPVAGVVVSADVGIAAQLRPGRGVRFALLRLDVQTGQAVSW